jgi:hypothetical protein
MAIAALPLTGVKRIHTYHGEADVLDMELTEPFQEKVRPQAKVELYGSGEHSHYQFKHAGHFRLEGIISYQSGYTQVAGHRSTKPGHGYATLTTSVTEGLNILDVVTADRVVAQISTEHPLDGAVPEVSFLGTRFENLRIAGRKIEVDTNLNILGPKPVDDGSYFDQSTVIDRMARQYEKISTNANLSDWARERYPKDSAAWRSKDAIAGKDTAQCSLVTGVQSDQKSFGHVIEVPHFGKFFLAELRVDRTAARQPKEYDSYNFHLTMIRFELGCPTQGSGGNTTADSNGTGKGSSPNP